MVGVHYFCTMYISPPMLHNGSDKPRVSLSCRQCQQRKKKCDKNQPCQSCTQYGIECVPISRARLPRGRHASKQNSADLRQRVARLESLTAIPVDFSQPVKHNTSAKNSVETLDSAWSAISEEVNRPVAIVGSLESVLLTFARYSAYGSFWTETRRTLSWTLRRRERDLRPKAKQKVSIYSYMVTLHAASSLVCLLLLPKLLYSHSSISTCIVSTPF